MMYHLYKAGNQDGAYARLDDGRFVSFIFDDNNPDYQAYQAWLAEGNTPEPYVAPPEPPPLTTEEKLAAAGITVDELKELLGL